MRNPEFLAGLLSDPAAFVTAEDFGGPHGEALRRWQEQGFISREAGQHPVPSCPHCAKGVPHRAAGRLVCATCRSAVEATHLLAWPVRRGAVFLGLASRFGVRGGSGWVTEDLWDLGTGTADGVAVACFVHPSGPVSPGAVAVLRRYRQVVILSASPPPGDTAPGRWVPLSGLLTPEGEFGEVTLSDVVRSRGTVRFDPETGVLRVGGLVSGEAPVGSREWALLTVLAEQLDQFVPYAILKREVLHRCGGKGGAEEATFCQKLKSRIKKEFIPDIDRLIVTSNKGDGYRLRAAV